MSGVHHRRESENEPHPSIEVPIVLEPRKREADRDGDERGGTIKKRRVAPVKMEES